jgi:acyl-CoA dehydrogenase
MSDRSIYFSEEHELLREQIRSFIASEVAPHGERWEQEGMVPRNLLKQMGELGLLGIRYPQKYGGA